MYTPQQKNGCRRRQGEPITQQRSVESYLKYFRWRRIPCLRLQPLYAGDWYATLCWGLICKITGSNVLKQYTKKVEIAAKKFWWNFKFEFFSIFPKKKLSHLQSAWNWKNHYKTSSIFIKIAKLFGRQKIRQKIWKNYRKKRKLAPRSFIFQATIALHQSSN